MNFDMCDKEQDVAYLSKTIKQLSKSANSIEDKIMLGRICGNLYTVNQTKVFEDSYWEETLVELLWREYIELPSKKRDLYKKELHILTECFSSGGHTRLLENLIKIRKKGDVLIVRKENSYKEKLCVNNESNVYSFADKDASLRDIVEIGQLYEVIYLHIHPDDIVVSVAVGILKKVLGKNIKVIFINHADHLFSFGFEYVDAIAEIGLNGYNVNKKYRKNKGKKSFFLGIPIPYSEFSLVSPRIFSEDKELLIVSAGADYKYSPFADYNFPLFVEKLLDSNIKFKLIILGADKASEYWKKIEKYKNVQLWGTVSHAKYMKIIKNADLYLDSWPLFGGTALPEIWATGKLVTGLKTPILGVTALQKLWFNNDLQLLQAIEDLYNNRENSEIYKLNISSAIRNKFVLNHSFSKINERLVKVINSNEVKFEYFTDYDLRETDSLFFYKIWKNNNEFINLPFNWKYLAEEIIKKNLLNNIVPLMQSKTQKYIMSRIIEINDLKCRKLMNELDSYKKEVDKIYSSFSWKSLRFINSIVRSCFKILGIKQK